MEPIPPDPVQRRQAADLVAQFGIDTDSEAGRALVKEATDGSPLELPAPPPEAAPSASSDAKQSEHHSAAVDVAGAHVQRAALTQTPTVPSRVPNGTWDVT